MVSFVGGERSEAAMRWLVENGIPAYNEPDTAVNAMAALREYARNKAKASNGFTKLTDVDEAKARAIIAQVRAAGDRNVTEMESKMVFEAYGLPVVTSRQATTEDEAAEMANAMGYPIVMKILSPDILHKSDAGGVKVGWSPRPRFARRSARSWQTPRPIMPTPTSTAWWCRRWLPGGPR